MEDAADVENDKWPMFLTEPQAHTHEHTGWMCALAADDFPFPSHIPTVTAATLQQGSQERLFRSDKSAEIAAIGGPCGNTKFSFQSPHTALSLDNCSTQDKRRDYVLTGVLLKVQANFIFLPFIQ